MFYARTATIEDGEHSRGSTTNYEQDVEMSIQVTVRTLATPRRVPWTLAYFPKRREKFRFLEL